MKLTVIFLTVGFLQVSASGLSQNVTLSGKNLPLEKVFDAIEKQTGFPVLYSKSKLAESRPVTLSVSNMPLESFLDLVFTNQPLRYTIEAQTIIVSPSPTATTPLPQVATDRTQRKDAPLAKISGTVRDAEGNALSGASIINNNTNVTVKADLSGNFKIDVEVGHSLTITYVGFIMESVDITAGLITSKDGVLVILEPNANPLDEIKIIAYGKTTDRMSTGNVANIKAKDIESQPVTNPLLALSGRIPGLDIVQNSGLFGGNVTVRVQGQNSIGSGNEPLYIVDGLPFPRQLPSNSAEGARGSGSALSMINPRDIESISVLKDADATSIFGSRAANGAILITTKKAKEGTGRLEVNIQQGLSHVPSKIPMMNRREYLDMRYEAFKNDSIDWTQPQVTANDLKFWDTSRTTDWQELLIGNTAKFNNYQLSVSGGSASTQYRLSGNYNRETTVFPGDFYNKRISSHLALNNTSFDQKLSIKLSSTVLFEKAKLIPFEPTQTAILTEPIAPSIFSSNGELNWALNSLGNQTWINPFARLSYSTSRNERFNFIVNASISYSLLDNLQLILAGGYNQLQSDDVSLQPHKSMSPSEQRNLPRLATFGNSSARTWNAEPHIQFKKAISKGNLTILAGSSIQQTRSQSQGVTARGHSSDALIEDRASAPDISVNNFYTLYKYAALFGQVNYTWDDRYVVNLTGRRDGSSRFGRENRFNNFGALGVAWVFTNENWTKFLSPVLSYGKLKCSYGTTGNEQIGEYGYLGLYLSNLGQDLPYQNSPGLRIERLPNPYLQWERVKKLSIGLDVGFLRERIVLQANFARNRSSNQLLGYSLPYTTGFSQITANFPATVENRNWEFTLQTMNLVGKKFNWHTSIVLTVPQNKLISFPTLETSSFANDLIVGEPLQIAKTYVYAGIDPETGLYSVKNKSGDITGTPDFEEDRTHVISLAPKLYGSIHNSISIGSFTMDVNIAYRNYIAMNSFFYSSGVQSPGNFFRNLSNQPRTVFDRWQKPGDEATVQKYSTGFLPSGTNLFWSDAMYNDASFIRLKTVNLSWSVSQAWVKKIRLNSIRLFANAQNLFTVTEFNAIDPETNSIFTLPPLRTIVFGVNVEL